MNEPNAYFNGRWVDAAELAVPIYDAGFVLGATVAEQLRTFGGKLFRLDDHLRRLLRSLEIVGVEPGLSAEQLIEIAREVIARNRPRVEPGDDLGLGIFVTPGAYANFADGAAPRPTVCVYSNRLQFGQWADKFTRGESVVVSHVRQVPASCWSPELKCRSRMHYFLADQDARRRDPGARAILLDQEGFVSEATTANLVLYRDGEGLVCPPQEKILPGISLMVLRELAAEQGIPFTHRDMLPDELCAADEVLLTSTSICVQPVVRCNHKPIGAGQPGAVYHQLLAAWSARVGLDIARQAQQFARRT
jgi:branched-subunit amino acid aminotransferase/4-amino-4-deoxychorismate lyase